MTILQTPPLAPTPSPTPTPGDNAAIIVGILDPAKIPAAPGDGCTPQLCDTMGSTTADLANPPGSGWVIAEIEASKGQPFTGTTLDEILGTTPSAAPSVIAGVLLSLMVITAAIAALIHHRRVAVTSPSATETEEV